MQYQHHTVDDAAETLVKELGYEYARYSAPTKTGQVYLSHQPMEGGYQLRRVIGSATTMPFLGEGHYPEKEMLDMITFALLSVMLVKQRVTENVHDLVERLK